MSFKINWDAMGITASIACAIHCAVLPLFLSSLPLFGINIIENMAFEYGMIGLAFIVGVYALTHGFKSHHHSKVPLLLFTIGIVFLVLKQIFIQWHVWLLLPAVSFIVVAHLLNFRYCRVHNHAHEEDCDHTHY